MKKIIKLLISSALVLSIMFSHGGTVYAATLESEQSNLVSIEEYEDAMSQIYANYGIVWKIIDSSDSVPITKELYDSEIKRAYKECEEYQAQLNKSKSGNFDSIQVTNTDMSSRLMPVNKCVSASTTIEDWPWYQCVLTATAWITYNADTGEMMSLDSWDINYTSVNMNEWVDEGSYIDKNRNFFRVWFIGKCHFSYIVPVTNQKISLSVPVNAGIVMN